MIQQGVIATVRIMSKGERMWKTMEQEM